MTRQEETSISFKALSGAMDDSPFAYVLFVNNFKILLDCGWTEEFDESQIANLKEYASSVDAVLISHSTIEHLGALPYLRQHCELSAPIYATFPVATLGMFLMYDYYCNKLDEGDFNLFNADDIVKTFDSITKLTFQQELRLSDQSITITPYRAGRSIGGAVWRIARGQHEVLYTNSIYNGDDQHINGFDHESASQWHPTLWIIDSRAGLMLGKEKGSNIFENLKRDLSGRLRRRRQMVLIPVDGLSRTLEILFRLNKFWEEAKEMQNYKMYYLSHSSDEIVGAVQQMSEWMSTKLVEEVVDTNKTPFELKFVERIKSMNDLPPQGVPCVILATTDALEHGFARKIFLQYGSSEQTVVYLTARQPKWTLSDMLAENETHREIDLVERFKEPLTGDELHEYQKRKESERLLHETVNEMSYSDEAEDDEGPEEGPEKPVVVKSVFQFHMKKKAPLSDYGAEIDQAEYAKGHSHAVVADEETVMKSTQLTNKGSQLQEPDDIPSKIIKRETRFNFRATRLIFNFEARSDFFQIKGFLQKCSPAHIIIIGGPQDVTKKLQNIVKDYLSKTKISTPSIGENVILTLDQSCMKIGLSRALCNGLDFKKVDENSEVAYVSAVLTNDDIAGMVSAKPIETDAAHHANFVGKIDMPKLRERLTESGIKVKAEGRLICGPYRVEIRQVKENELSVDGPMCVDFIKIRSIIQEMLVMV